MLASDTETALAHLPDWAESIERAMALYAKWARESPRHRVPRAGAQAAKDVSRAFAYLAQRAARRCRQSARSCESARLIDLIPHSS